MMSVAEPEEHILELSRDEMTISFLTARYCYNKIHAAALGASL